MSLHTLFCIPLLLLSSLFLAHLSVAHSPVPNSVHPLPDPDRACTTGIRVKRLCCHPSCSSCGSRKCASDGHRNLCCGRQIWQSGRHCSLEGPPCILTHEPVSPRSLPAASPSKSPRPSVWRFPKRSPLASRSSTRAPAPSITPQVSASRTPPPAADSADPLCETGIQRQDVCCPASCGECGGKGCWANGSGRGECCPGKIRRDGRVCEQLKPPCVLTPNVAESPSATPAMRDGGVWRTVEVMGEPSKRHEACFVWVDGKGYLVGGRGNKPVDAYDPVEGTWTKKRRGPKLMHHMQCVGYDGKVWVASSWGGLFPFETNNELLYVYDTMTDEWSSRAGLPQRRLRGGAAAVLYDDKIYVVGGNRGGHGEHAEAVGWMDYYDLKTEEWRTELASLPSPRDHTGGAIWNGMLCVASGRDSGVGDFFAATKASTWCYDFEKNAWTDMGAALGLPRAGAAVGTTCEGVMMVAGGETETSPAKSRVEVFGGGQWRRVADLVTGRHGSGLGIAECSCGDVYIASGSGGKGGGPELTSTEVYTAHGGEARCGRRSTSARAGGNGTAGW